MAITVGEVEIIVRARLEEFYEDVEKGAKDAGAETGTKFAAEFEQSVAGAGPITPEVALDVDTSDLEKGFEDVGKVADVAAEGIEKGFEDVGASVNETGEGMESMFSSVFSSVGGKFDKLKSRMQSKIVMGIAIAGITMAIDEIQARWTQLQDTFALVTQPPSINKDMAILNEAIAQQERAILKIPGALDELYRKRQELIELEITAENRARTMTGFLAAHVQREQEAAVDLTAAVDVWTSGMSGAVQPINAASASIAGSIDTVGVAAQASQEDVDKAFDGMLQSILDMQDPTNKAAKAYNAALQDPLVVDERIREIIAEIEKVAPDLESEAPNVKAGAELYTKALEDELAELKAVAEGYGSDTSRAYVDGIVGRLKEERPRIGSEMDLIREIFATGSPPGPKAALYGIDTWGAATAHAFVDPLLGVLRGSRGDIRSALGGLASDVLGGSPLSITASPFTGSGAAPAGRTGSSVNVNVYNPAPEPASQSTEERLRILAATGII